MTTFKSQDRIAIIRNGNLLSGCFVGHIGSENAAVLVDIGGLVSVSLTDLLSEEDGEKALQTVREEESRLEQEFEIVRSAVGAQLKISADAFREATRIAGGSSLSYDDFYDEIRPLMRAMNDAGWSSSSLFCSPKHTKKA